MLREDELPINNTMIYNVSFTRSNTFFNDIHMTPLGKNENGKERFQTFVFQLPTNFQPYILIYILSHFFLLSLEIKLNSHRCDWVKWRTIENYYMEYIKATKKKKKKKKKRNWRTVARWKTGARVEKASLGNRLCQH